MSRPQAPRLLRRLRRPQHGVHPAQGRRVRGHLRHPPQYQRLIRSHRWTQPNHRFAPLRQLSALGHHRQDRWFPCRSNRFQPRLRHRSFVWTARAHGCDCDVNGLFSAVLLGLLRRAAVRRTHVLRPSRLRGRRQGSDNNQDGFQRTPRIRDDFHRNQQKRPEAKVQPV